MHLSNAAFVDSGTSADEGVGICHAICEYLLTLKVGEPVIVLNVQSSDVHHCQ